MLFLAKIAHAQAFSNTTINNKVGPIVGRIMDAIVIPLVEGLFAIAVLVFLWGIFKLIAQGGDPTVRKEAQSHVLWGVVGMAIMVSVYGIIRVIASTVGFPGDPFN